MNSFSFTDFFFFYRLTDTLRCWKVCFTPRPLPPTSTKQTKILMDSKIFRRTDPKASLKDTSKRFVKKKNVQDGPDHTMVKRRESFVTSKTLESAFSLGRTDWKGFRKQAPKKESFLVDFWDFWGGTLLPLDEYLVIWWCGFDGPSHDQTDLGTRLA